MERVERVHEVVSSPPDQECLRRKAVEGWRLAAVVWERDAPADAAPALADVPFGFRVAADCRHLQEHPDEKQVLLAILEMLVQDRSLPDVAAELNRRGLRTRGGASWSPASVFQLLPQVIESGPKVLGSREWVERRQRIFRAI